MACNESFNPDGPYDRKLVVYAVLSNQNDTQYVRVYASYPPMSNPSYAQTDDQVTDAQVTIARGGTIYQFHDTTVTRSSPSRYLTPVYLHVAYGFPIAQATRYSLTVNSPTWGKASASIVSLYRGGMYVSNTTGLTNPRPSAVVSVRVAPGFNCAAYIVRMFFDYVVHDAGQQSAGRVEVPLALQAGSSGPDAYIYPAPILRGHGSVTDTPGEEVVIFSSEVSRRAADDLRARYPGDTVRFSDAILYLTQMDSVLYSYYNVINGFPGSGALRLDEPDYSNIRGGLGIFASTTVDSVILPISIPSNRPAASSAAHAQDLLDPRK